MTSSQPGTSPAISAAERLIVALDAAGRADALEIVNELRGEVGAFKVGLELFTSVGPSFVEDLTDSGVRVFLDLKFHDIPNTVAGAAAAAARLGVWMFNVHCIGGGEMMRRAVESVNETCLRENLERPLLIGVTILTSSDHRTLAEVGIGGPVDEEVSRLASLCRECGLDGVVASAAEANAIKELDGGSRFLVVTPGIRPKTATNDDQKRVMTPGGAVAAGADYLVVGRSITAEPDRRLAARSIIAEIEAMTR